MNKLALFIIALLIYLGINPLMQRICAKSATSADDSLKILFEKEDSFPFSASAPAAK
jgi:hypothetical protein